MLTKNNKMRGLYVVSTTEYAGKSTISLALAFMLRAKGKNVAYMKPIGTLPTKVNGQDSCEDVDYIWSELDKPGDLKNVCPIVLLARFAEKAIGKEKTDYRKIITGSAASLAKTHDIVVVEGAGNINQGAFIGLAAADVAKLLNLPTLLLAKYSDMLTIDEIIQAAKGFQPNLVGVIINMVPSVAKDVIESVFKPFLAKHNINLLGYLLKDQTLASVSVGKIADHLNGKIIAGEEHLDKMVESFMVGAMSQEQAISFFRKKANKAVVTGGDRSDVQLAALETATNALILTGNLTPRPLVVSKAEEAGVPVILVRDDTLTTIEKTEQLMSHVRVHENHKIQRMQDLLGENIKLSNIFNAVS